MTTKVVPEMFDSIIADGTLTPRTLQTRFATVYNVKDFGATGDGVTDDRAAIQLALNAAVAVGGVAYVPSGTYRINSALSVKSATLPWMLCGAGMYQSTLVRGADYGSMLGIDNCSNWTIRDLGYNAKFSVYTVSANHGIAYYNASYSTIENVYVTDWKNTAILGYTDPDAPSTYSHNLLRNVLIDGLNASNNGVLFANFTDSGFVNVRALNIGKTGSPCYALQFKESCLRCYMIGGYASGATIGVALGNTGAGGDVGKDGIITGVHIYNCDTGIAFGNTSGYAVSNCVIDMITSATSLAAIDFNTNSWGHNVKGISVKNLFTAKPAAKFRSGDTDNVVNISTIECSSGTAQPCAEFLSGALRNSVTLDRYVLPTTVVSSTSLVTNSGGETNSFEYLALVQRQLLTIAAGVITIRDNKVSFARVDTEAAAASDDLDTINGGTDFQRITLIANSNTRDVVMKHATGNIMLTGSVDFTLDHSNDTISLYYNSANATWCEIGRGNNT